MSFIKNIVGPNEHIIGVVRVHWIYGAKGLVWLAFCLFGYLGFSALASAIFVDFNLETAFPLALFLDQVLFWLAMAMGVTMFISYFLMMISTELGLTDERLIIKKGLIFVDVREVDLEELKSSEVDHGVLGRLFNYGYLHFDARFIKDTNFPAIPSPYRFLKAVNEVRDQKMDTLQGLSHQHADSKMPEHKPQHSPQDDSHKAIDKRAAVASDDIRLQAQASAKQDEQDEQDEQDHSVQMAEKPLEEELMDDFKEEAALPPPKKSA